MRGSDLSEKGCSGRLLMEGEEYASREEEEFGFTIYGAPQGQSLSWSRGLSASPLYLLFRSSARRSSLCGARLVPQDTLHTLE